MSLKNTKSSTPNQSEEGLAELVAVMQSEAPTNTHLISSCQGMESMWNQKDVSCQPTGPSLLLSDPSIPNWNYDCSSKQTTILPSSTSSGTQNGPKSMDSSGAWETSSLPSGSTELDPSGLASKAPGAKLDAGKVDVLRGAYQYFPNALHAVAHVSELGARKYSWKGWEKVPDGIRRYGAALARHLVFDHDQADTGTGGLGPDVLHASQVAWNALARLELILKEKQAT